MSFLYVTEIYYRRFGIENKADSIYGLLIVTSNFSVTYRVSIKSGDTKFGKKYALKIYRYKQLIFFKI